MKRKLTFVFTSIHYDYKAKHSKELEKRVGMKVKVVGELLVGKSLELHFEDGFIFKTAGLDLGGYINQYKRDADDPIKQILDHVVLCTKDISFILNISKEDFKIKLNEQLKLEV